MLPAAKGEFRLAPHQRGMKSMTKSWKPASCRRWSHLRRGARHASRASPKCLGPLKRTRLTRRERLSSASYTPPLSRPLTAGSCGCVENFSSSLTTDSAALCKSSAILRAHRSFKLQDWAPHSVSKGTVALDTACAPQQSTKKPWPPPAHEAALPPRDARRAHHPRCLADVCRNVPGGSQRRSQLLP